MCRGLDHSLTYMAAHLLQRTESVIEFGSTSLWNLTLSLQQSLTSTISASTCAIHSQVQVHL